MTSARLFIGLRPEPANEDDEVFRRRLKAFLKAAKRSYRIVATVIVVNQPDGKELPVEESEATV